MRIGLDSDGVIYNFTQVYNSHLIELGHKLEPEAEAETWDYFTKYGYTSEDFLSHMDDLVDAKRLFWEGELYEPDIPEKIDQLRAAGHTIHIVTNRFSGKVECAEEATRHWFKSKKINYDSLTFSKDKTVVPTDIFLEDNLKNFEAIWMAGSLCYLVNRPYNQTGEDEAFRVDTFAEFANLWLPGSPWWMAQEYVTKWSGNR